MAQNYCQNELTVSGPADDIAAFSSSVEGTEDLLSFQRLIPEPNLGMLGGSKGWLNWRITHWGCKWDALDVERSQNSRTGIAYNYDTGFGVALNPIREASRLWPELTFQLSYASPGEWVAGAVTFKNGLTVEERIGRYSDVCVDDPSGTEPDPLYLSPLSVVCGRLPLSDRGDAIVEFRRALLENGPRELENVENILLRLGDPDSTLAYCLLPATDTEHVWELLSRSAGDTRGGRVLLALRAGDDQRLATLARLISHLQGALITPGETLGESLDVLDRDGVARLRGILEAAENEGDIEGFTDTLMNLSPDWEGSGLDEFLDAAWRLHF